MRAFSVLVIFGAILQGSASPAGTQIINQGLFDTLSRFWVHANNAYVDNCVFPSDSGLEVKGLFGEKGKPNNKTLLGTGNQGYIALDTRNKEIIVAFRGSEPIGYDWFTTNFNLFLVDYKLTEFGRSSAPRGTQVHGGFLDGYNSVVYIVLSQVRTLLQENKGYTVVTVGHSMGGALASLAAMSLKDNLPGATNIKMYTYGQPRTGDTEYVAWVNSKNRCTVQDLKQGRGYFCSYRVTRSGDAVPLTPLNDQGYRHHGVEYYQRAGSVSAGNIRVCNLRSRFNEFNEEKDCLAREKLEYLKPGKLLGIRKAHSEYLGIPSDQTSCIRF